LSIFIDSTELFHVSFPLSFFLCRFFKASFKIPTEKLEYKGFSGEEVALRIIEAYEWAESDPFRASTHNKGIMNGIDAVALATGQDWRAIEAAAHTWAIHAIKKTKKICEKDPHNYGSLTKYWIEESLDESNTKLFCGELELPLAVGTKGGVLVTNSSYHYTMGLMGFPSSQKLAMVG